MRSSPLKAEGQNSARISNGPYEDLFIYLIEGRVTDEDEQTCGEHFMGNWVEDNTSFLFFSAPSDGIVSELLQRRADLALIEDYHFSYEQWQGDRSKALTIEDFFIVPPWEEVEPEEGKMKIMLDPGVVFGTGLHPTTRDCLRALIYLHRQCPVGEVVDLGTGTGILALAAVYLGAKKVLAVDLNPLSVRTAKKNVVLNGLEGAIEVIEGQAEDFVDEKGDLIVANLHHEMIVKLIEKKGFQAKIWSIISGMMRSEAREVKLQLGRYNLKVIHEWDHEATWYTLLVRNDNL
jgi:ribosomal protein L11 methyltransferase